MASLQILYQDDSLVAVNKPAGQLVHPSDHPQPGDEVTMKILRDQIGHQVHPLHRIDRPTCGVVLFSTEARVVRILRPAFDENRIKKTYLAVVLGQPDYESHLCQLPLRKREDSPLQEARTLIKVLQKISPDLTLLEAQPQTGRFHQIRRHLKLLGTPIVGDYRYAGPERCDSYGKKLNIGTRMLLQAKELAFVHPETGDLLTISAPIDPLIAQLTSQ